MELFDIKRASIIKNNKIIGYIINSLIIHMVTNYNIYDLRYYFSNISLKIKGKGEKNVFCSMKNDFPYKYYPKIVYINGAIQNNVNYSYFFEQEDNEILLTWIDNLVDCENMFRGCINISEVDLSNFNTSEVTDMARMFFGCSSLKSINLSSPFNTLRVTDMTSMFLGCSSLNSIDLSNFNTSRVTKMSAMFQGCSFISIDVSNFNTKQVTTMGYLFFQCSSLNSINLSNFDTSLVNNMESMFSGCSSLISIDISNFNVSKVTNMRYMFSDCSRLTTINLSNFNTSGVKNMRNMFWGCTHLKYINLFNLDLNSLNYYNDMFSNVSDNIVVCINEDDINIKEKILPLLQEKKCYTNDCSENWESNKRKNAKPECIEEETNTFINKEIEAQPETQQNIIYNDLKDIINLLNITEEIEYYETILNKTDSYFTSDYYNTSNLDKGIDDLIIKTEKKSNIIYNF